jgi:hypothetical protein
LIKKLFGGELFDGSKKLCLRLYSPFGESAFMDVNEFSLIGTILGLSWMMLSLDSILYIIKDKKIIDLNII